MAAAALRTGPLSMGPLLESVAIPEIRVQAQKLADLPMPAGRE
jgi:hypothetical protein